MSGKNEAGDAGFLSVLMDCHGDRGKARGEGGGLCNRISMKEITLFIYLFIYFGDAFA